MILTLNSDEFAEAVKRHKAPGMNTQVIYYWQFRLPHGGNGYRLTYAAPEQNMMIITDMFLEGRGSFNLLGGQPTATGDKEFDDTVTELTRAGFKLARGVWTSGEMQSQSATQTSQQATPTASSDQEQTASTEYYIAAVSYLTSDGSPDVWLSAYPTQPYDNQITRAMYQEFVDSGDLENTTYEEFIKATNPTILITHSNELLGQLVTHPEV